MLASIHWAVINVAPNGGHHLKPAITCGYYNTKYALISWSYFLLILCVVTKVLYLLTLVVNSLFFILVLFLDMLSQTKITLDNYHFYFWWGSRSIFKWKFWKAVIYFVWPYSVEHLLLCETPFVSVLCNSLLVI